MSMQEGVNFVQRQLYNTNYGREVANTLQYTGQRIGEYVGTRRRENSLSPWVPRTRGRKRQRVHYDIQPEVEALSSGRVNSTGIDGVGVNMSGSFRYIGPGKAVVPNNPLKVSIKIEKGQSQAAWNCVYVGGATHPAQATFSMVVQSLVRFMMLRANIDFGSFDEDMLFPGLSSQTFSFDYWWRQDTRQATALTLVSVSSAGLGTWSSWAGAIGDSLVSTFGSGPTQTVPSDAASPARRLCYIALRGTGTAPVVASQFYKADDIFIAVKGESKVQVQNRTKADSGTDKETTESIFVNPLRGKYYNFQKGRPYIKSVGNVQATQLTYFPYGAQAGEIARADRFGATPDTNFAGPVNAAMRKPPPGYWFSNCSHSRYCAVDPGQILQAACADTVNMTLASWLYRLRDKFFQVTTKTFNALATQDDPVEYRLGISHMFALEKMCDTAPASEAASVVVGLEHTLYMAATVEWKPTMGIVPQINIST